MMKSLQSKTRVNQSRSNTTFLFRKMFVFQNMMIVSLNCSVPYLEYSCNNKMDEIDCTKDILFFQIYETIHGYIRCEIHGYIEVFWFYDSYQCPVDIWHSLELWTALWISNIISHNMQSIIFFGSMKEIKETISIHLVTCTDACMSCCKQLTEVLINDDIIIRHLFINLLLS